MVHKNIFEESMLHVSLNALVMISTNRNLWHKIYNFYDGFPGKFIPTKDREIDFCLKKITFSLLHPEFYLHKHVKIDFFKFEQLSLANDIFWT